MIPAIIIARGGSVRIPRKNVKLFCGLPLVEWSILQAVNSHHIGAENIYLSTDDDEIASIGEKHKINIIRRPDWKDPDSLSGGVPVRHALDTIYKTRDFDAFMTILPTSPLRLPGDMDRIIDKYTWEIGNEDWICITWMVPQQEVDIFRMQNETHTYRWLLNKTGKLAKEAVNAILFNRAPQMSLPVMSTSENKDAYQNKLYLRPGKHSALVYYITAEWFQQFEIDIIDQFQFCEVLMEHYILKGRGAEIYEEYARSKL